MVVSVHLQSGATLEVPGNPIKLSAARPQVFTAPPLLGEHTDEVLGQLLGYTAEQRTKLRESGTIS